MALPASKEEALHQLQRLKDKENKRRLAERAQGEKFMGLFLSTAGAAAGAFVDAYLVKNVKSEADFAAKSEADKKKAIEEGATLGGIDASIVAGGALAVMGVASFLGDYDEAAMDLGQGMIAGAIARKVYDEYSEPEKKE